MLEPHNLEIIKLNHPSDVEKCCLTLFKIWLERDVEASWNKLINALIEIEYLFLADKIKKEILICMYITVTILYHMSTKFDVKLNLVIW